MNFKKLENEEINFKRINVFGNNGTGKTSFAATMPGNILLINVNEDGMNSIPQSLRSKIISVDVRSTEDFINLIKIFQSGELEKHAQCKIDSIVIDTVTQLQEIFILEAETIYKQQYLTAKGTFNAGEMWGTLARYVKLLLMAIKSADLNLLSIFQEKQFVDNNTVVEIGLKAATNIRSLFADDSDVIVQLQLENFNINGENVVKHVANLEKHPLKPIKVRTSDETWETKNKIIVDPTYDKLINLIKGEK